MANNHYYGYTLKNQGTPKQHWVFSSLPITDYPKVITSTSTSPVLSGNTQFISDINLEPGVYKFEISMIVQSEAAGQFEVDLVKDQQVIGKAIFGTAEDSNGKYTGEATIMAVSKVCPCDTSISLVNNSETTYTPILVNNSSLLMVVTKLY